MHCDTGQPDLKGAHACRKNALNAHLISTASGAVFSMYLSDMKAKSEAGLPPEGVER